MSQNRVIPTLIPLVGLALLAAMAVPATAAQVPIFPPVTLADLVDDPADSTDDPDAFIISPSGRFKFDEFTFSSVPPEDYVPEFDDIFINVTETSDTVMLLFQIVGKNLATGDQAYDIQIGYRAEALTNAPFTGHELMMNGAGMGDGTVFINENIFDSDGNLIAQLTTHDNVSNLPDVAVATSAFTPSQVLTIQDKDIAVTGGGDEFGNAAFLSHFKQTFFVVPEPSSVALLILGGLGMGAICLRRGSRSE